jgi:hypothetical protein
MSTIAIVNRSSGKAAGVLAGDIAMPARGNWIAHLEVGTEAPFVDGDLVKVVVAGDEGKQAANAFFFGFVRRVGSWGGRSRLVVAGGAGGLSDTIDGDDLIASPDHDVPLELAARRICEAAGERLSETVDLTGREIPRWTRARSTALQALDVLADAHGLGWRVLDDGSIWVGEETFPELPRKSVGLQIALEPDDDLISCGVDGAADLRPGTAVLGRRVQRVAYTLEGSFRAELQLETAGGSGATAGGGIPANVRPIVYREFRACKVVKRHPDDSLDLVPDDDTLPGMRQVSLRVGLPHCRVLLDPGARVLVAFEGASPAFPYAVTHANDDGATHGIARVGDSVDCGWVRVVVDGSAPSGYGLASSAPSAPGAFHLIGVISSGSAEAFLR